MGVGSIVVGVDGSPESRAALEFAVEEARRRGGALVRVVYAVALPEFWAVSYPAYLPPPPQKLVGAAHREIETFVDDVLAAGGGPGELPISVETRTGRAGESLVAAAEGADLLVVGHRGRGSVTSMLLGSVGLYCVAHATCPVTVVRARRQAVSEPARVMDVAVAPA